MVEIPTPPQGVPLTLGRTRMALRRFQYSPTVVRIYGGDEGLLASYTGNFDGTRVMPGEDELRLYFDLPHFLAWVGSPNGTRLDLSRLSAFRVGSHETGDEAVELWREGRRLMEIRPADADVARRRTRGRCRAR